MSTAQREMEAAMYQFAAQRLVYLIPGTATEKPAFVSSGTPIETAGGNVLVLTARHCARDAVDRQMRVGYHRAERTVDDGVFGVVHHPDSSIDVSVLVLHRAARDIVRPLAIDLNLVAADEVSPSTDPLMLAGFPAALVKHHGKNWFGMGSITYGTGLATPAFDETGRYRVDWSGAVTSDGVVQLPHPKGISGGALWRFRPAAPDALWSALGSGRLVGIPVAWKEAERVELAEPAAKWRAWLLETAAMVDSSVVLP